MRHHVNRTLLMIQRLCVFQFHCRQHVVPNRQRAQSQCSLWCCLSNPDFIIILNFLYPKTLKTPFLRSLSIWCNCCCYVSKTLPVPLLNTLNIISHHMHLLCIMKLFKFNNRLKHHPSPLSLLIDSITVI